ncbi:MAG: DUF4957 domain-containing protein [Mangrovibacterium sp.]
MKRYLKNIALLCCAASLSFTACEDDIDPIVEGLGNTARVFSPSDVEVRVFNNVNARVYWDDVKNAERFNVAFFIDSLGQDLANLDFESDAFVKIEYNVGSTTSADPYVAYSLPQDTALTVYVQAVSLLEGTANSKWTPVYFETKAENIISSIETTNSVIRVTWEAGAAATVVKMLADDVETEHLLTADEIAAGAVELEAAPGTTYTISIWNGDAVRGETTATTKPDGTVVSEGADLATAIAEAADGAVLLLEGGVYAFEAETNIKIEKSITIVNADDATRPTIKNVLFTISATDIDVTLQGLNIDGLNGGDSHVITVGDVATLGNIHVEDCEISNYAKGIIYANYAVEIATITFYNNVFENIACNGADCIDIRKSYTPALTVTHNTFNNIGYDSKRQVIRFDGNIGGNRNSFDGTGANDGKQVEIIFSNNTCYYAPGNELLYTTFSGASVTANANLFVTPEDDRGRWCGRGTLADEIPFACADNHYFGTAGMYDKESGISADTYDTAGVVLEANPYKRPDRGDFSVSADLSGDEIGSSRWW